MRPDTGHGTELLWAGGLATLLAAPHTHELPSLLVNLQPAQPSTPLHRVPLSLCAPRHCPLLEEKSITSEEIGHTPQPHGNYHLIRKKQTCGNDVGEAIYDKALMV